MLPVICTEEYSSIYRKHSDENTNSNTIMKESSRLTKIIRSSSNPDLKYKTSFKNLNLLYNDGLIPGLYIIGAEPGVGKTSFCLQLADDFVQNNYDVIYISLEMSELELVTKSMSRFSYILDKDNAFSYNDIFNNLSGIDNNEKLLNIVKLYHQKVYHKITIVAPNNDCNNFTTLHILQTIVNYVNVHKKRPILIVDYLQILKIYRPYDDSTETKDPKKEIMEIIKLMKEYSRTYNIPIILISSLNRASYKKSKENLSLDCFKETGGIEYTADCAVVLTSDRIDDDTFEVNYNVLKNRFGKSDVSVSFEFIPKYSYFKETSDDI